MKKNTLGLLAGLCVLLTGCGGTKYTNEKITSDNGVKVETNYALSLKDREANTGDFKLTKKSKEEYPSGHRLGLTGLVKLDADVKVVISYTKTGTWEFNENTETVTLKTFEMTFQAKVTGDDASTYKDYLEGVYTLTYGSENAKKMVSGDKVTITSEDGFVNLVTLDEENKTFEGLVD